MILKVFVVLSILSVLVESNVIRGSGEASASDEGGGSDIRKPILRNYGQVVKGIPVNKPKILLPCPTKYHTEHEDAIHLYWGRSANGEQILRNDTRFIKYYQNKGFELDMGSLELIMPPNNVFTCVVENSTRNDFLVMELNVEYHHVNVIPSSVHVRREFGKYIFFANDPDGNWFSCSGLKSSFQNNFRFWLMIDNKTVSVSQEIETEIRESSGISERVAHVRLVFPTTSVSHVVCQIQLENSSEWANGSLPVQVIDPIPPRIFGDEVDIPYKDNLSLTCLYESDPRGTVSWHKNNETTKLVQKFEEIIHGANSSNTVHLYPTNEDETNYTCVVTNFAGSASKTYNVKKTKVDAPMSHWIWAFITAPTAATILLAAVISFLAYSFWTTYGKHYGTITREKNKLKDWNVDWEGSEKIGEGQYGEIWSAKIIHKLTKNVRNVVMKVIKIPVFASDKQGRWLFEDFVNEIVNLAKLHEKGGHENVVNYLGVVVRSLLSFRVYIVLDYYSPGDLEKYLQTKEFEYDFYRNGMWYYQIMPGRIVRPPTRNAFRTIHLIKWCVDIANGMKFLEEKQIVHRDLASRNIILAYRSDDESIDSVKAIVSDFGMTRDLTESGQYLIPPMEMDRERKPRATPIWWYSVEALENRGYDHKSDVWSFGVLMWEMFTFAAMRPYLREVPSAGLPNETVRQNLIRFLRNGGRLTRPPHVPDEIWWLMVSCWNETPSERPTFTELHQRLQGIMLQYNTDNIPFNHVQPVDFHEEDENEEIANHEPEDEEGSDSESEENDGYEFMNEPVEGNPPGPAIRLTVLNDSPYCTFSQCAIR